MARANWVGGVWMCALWGALTAFVGCNGSSTSNSCIAYCDNLCSSLEACDLSVEDCRSSCEADLTDKACRGQAAPDRLTCGELTQVVACGQYCAALCERAPKCGTFDSAACVTGCLEEKPSICNPASVDARTCDQLKPEIRLYESIGGEQDGDSDSAGGGGFGTAFGLCKDARGCELPLGCSQETNTCGPCKNDEECAGMASPHACSAENECIEVECLSNDDCFLTDACDTETHECVDCLKDADCTSGACDTAAMKCVQCKKDSDCKSPFAPSCDEEQNKCVECGKDSDCTSRFRPACDLEARKCVTCNEDAQCADDSYSPACDADAHECVECTADIHCPEESPRCDTKNKTCRQCWTNDDCGEERPRCDIASLSCSSCETNADCADEDKPVCTESGRCGACENDEACAPGEECDTYFGKCVPPESPR